MNKLDKTKQDSCIKLIKNTKRKELSIGTGITLALSTASLMLPPVITVAVVAPIVGTAYARFVMKTNKRYRKVMNIIQD